MTTKIINPRKPVRLHAKQHMGNFLFLLPTIVLFVVVVLVPFFQGIPYSFMRWKEIITSPTPYFTAENTLWEKITLSFKSYNFVIHNKQFLRSLGVTFHFTGELFLLGGVPFG